MAMPAGRGGVGQSNLTRKGSLQRLRCGRKGVARHAAALASKLLHNMRVTSIEKMRGVVFIWFIYEGDWIMSNMSIIEYFSLNSHNELNYSTKRQICSYGVCLVT